MDNNLQFEFNSIDELNGYYFDLFEQTKGLIQSCDKHYFKYVQNLLVKRYKRDVRRFVRQEKKDFRKINRQNNNKFNKILRELSQKYGINANAGSSNNNFPFNRPTADSQPPKANTGDQETGEQLQQFAQETRQSIESPDNQSLLTEKQAENQSQDDFMPL